MSAMRITVQPRRAEALQAGYAALTDRIPSHLSYGAFIEALHSWDVRAFCDGERVVGMLMTKGPELHVAVLPEVRGKWLSRRLIREVFAPIERDFGSARTKVAEGNAVGRDLVERIRRGFASLEFDPTTALVSAGASLLGGAIQGSAAEKAAGQQAGAANAATAAQLQMFNTQNQQQAPYRQAGTGALGLLGGYAGVPGYGVGPTNYQPFQWNGQTFTNRDDLRNAIAANYGKVSGGMDATNPAVAQSIDSQTDAILAGVPKVEGQANPLTGSLLHQFNAEDLKSNLTPNYQFMLGQGLSATENKFNASGGALSGNTLKGLTDYATNFAGNAYQNAFANYTTNQTNIFNRLSAIAGLGQTANAQSTQLTGALAPSIASSTIGAGTAAAGGTIGAANALTGGASNALGWYNLGNLLKPQSAGGDLAGQGVG